MVSLKVNVDKMRRHAAKTSPDKVSAKFDPIDDDYEDQCNKWIKQFQKRMKIKHGDDIRIDVYMNSEIALKSHQVLITAEVRLRDRKAN